MTNVWTALSGLPPISPDTMILLTGAAVLAHDSAGPKHGAVSGMARWGKLAVTGSTCFRDVPRVGPAAPVGGGASSG